MLMSVANTRLILTASQQVHEVTYAIVLGVVCIGVSRPTFGTDADRKLVWVLKNLFVCHAFSYVILFASLV